MLKIVLILFSIFFQISFLEVYAQVPTKNPVELFEGYEDEDLSDVQVPIPMKDRVFNKSGIQCVWCSFETLARYAEEEKLYNLTDRREYQGKANSNSAASMLKRFKIRYEQTTSTNDRHLLIKGCVVERRGVAFDIRGHMMVLVHYDEGKGIVKYINNSDPTLKIRVWTMAEFNKRWRGWAAIIYADNDIIPSKYIKSINMQILDRNNPQEKYQKEYILMPIAADLDIIPSVCHGRHYRRRASGVMGDTTLWTLRDRRYFLPTQRHTSL